MSHQLFGVCTSTLHVVTTLLPHMNDHLMTYILQRVESFPWAVYRTKASAYLRHNQQSQGKSFPWALHQSLFMLKSRHARLTHGSWPKHIAQDHFKKALTPRWLSQLSDQLLILAHHLMVHGIEPRVWLLTDSTEPAWDSLSPSLYSSPAHTVSLSLSKINS